MNNEHQYTHPQDQLLLQKEPVLKPSGRILYCLEVIIGMSVFLILCAIMFHIVN